MATHIDYILVPTECPSTARTITSMCEIVKRSDHDIAYATPTVKHGGDEKIKKKELKQTLKKGEAKQETDLLEFKMKLLQIHTIQRKCITSAKSKKK